MGSSISKSNKQTNSEIKPNVKAQQKDTSNKIKDAESNPDRVETKSGKELDSYKQLQSEGRDQQPELKIKSNIGVLDSEECYKSGEEAPPPSLQNKIFTKADLTQYKVMSFETVDSDDEQDDARQKVSGKGPTI